MESLITKPRSIRTRTRWCVRTHAPLDVLNLSIPAFLAVRRSNDIPGTVLFPCDQAKHHAGCYNSLGNGGAGVVHTRAPCAVDAAGGAQPGHLAGQCCGGGSILCCVVIV